METVIWEASAKPKQDQYSSRELTKLKFYSFSATVHTFHLHIAKPASQSKHSQKQPCSTESPRGSLVLNKKPFPREYICNEPLPIALASDCTSAPSGSYESHRFIQMPTNGFTTEGDCIVVSSNALVKSMITACVISCTYLLSG